MPAGRLPEKLAAELSIALLPSGLRVPALVAPYPAGRGRRQPYLATPEKDERDAAIAETLVSLGTAADLGAGAVIIALGELPVEHEWSKLVRAFERGEDVEDRVDRARNLRRRRARRGAG